MKINNLPLILVIVILSCLSTKVSYAQVTIGKADPPAGGALLQLKNMDEAANTTNANKGLLLPRVQLVDLEKLQPMYSYVDVDNTPTMDEKIAHVGLIIYNVPNDMYCPDIRAGLYAWNGEQWGLLLSRPNLGTVAGKSGTAYQTRKFGKAGEWMIENLREREYDTGETGTLSIGYLANATNKIYYFPTTSNTDPSTGNLANDSLYFHGYPQIGLLYSRGAATNGKTTNTILPDGLSTTPSTVQGICPTGWVVPSDYDWNELEKEIANNPQLYSNTPIGSTKWINGAGEGGNPDTNWASTMEYRPDVIRTEEGHGKSMKSCQGVTTGSGSGTPTYGSSHPDGFNALLAGYVGYQSSGTDSGPIRVWNLSTNAVFWSSTRYIPDDKLIHRGLFFVRSGVVREPINNIHMLSVRCKKS